MVEGANGPTSASAGGVDAADGGGQQIPEAVASLAEALSAAVRPGQVLDVLADIGGPIVGAQSINISLLDESGESLRLVVSRRSSPQVRIQFASYPMDAPYPTRDALSSGRPVLIRSVQERDARWPALAQVQVAQCSWAVLPLHAGGRTLGTVGFGWMTPQAFGPEQVQLFEQVADLAAAALARAQLFDDVEQARTAADELAERLGVLQTLTGRLAGATDLAAVGDLVVGAAPRALGADAATIGLLDGQTFTALASVGVPDDLIPHWSTRDVSGSVHLRDLLADLRPIVVTSSADRAARYPDPARDDTFQASATLPLVIGGALVGVVAYGWKQPRTFDSNDLDYLSAIASNAATAIDRSRLLNRANQAAETLQRALLPEVVRNLEGWDLATCYVPAVEGTRVGGDWYDAFVAPDGNVVLALGDVAGKGVRAAAVMGAVRSALRAYAMLDPTPATVLDRLDGYFAAFKKGELVTCALAALDPRSGRLAYANAGHPPPLMIGRASTRWLDQALTPPLGADNGILRSQADHVIDPGEVLLLYSDGLVERRDQDPYESLDDLAAAAVTLPGSPDLDTATEALIRQLDHPARVVDDTALLALRRHGTVGDGANGVPRRPVEA